MADEKRIEDGGTAFPCQPLGTDGLPVMEMAPGMSLRDWFAGMAMQGLLAQQAADWNFGAGWNKEVVQLAWRISDDMLAARKHQD